MKFLAAILLTSLFLFGCVQPGASQATPTPIEDVLHEDVTATPTPTQTPTATPTPEPTSTPQTTATPSQEATETPEPTEATTEPSVEPSAEAEMQEATVEVDDNAWYPGQLTVKKGVPLTLTIKMRSENVYFAGGDVKSDAFETMRFEPGQTQSVTFTPQGQVKISNYWPSSGVLKGTLTIDVN